MMHCPLYIRFTFKSFVDSLHGTNFLQADGSSPIQDISPCHDADCYNNNNNNNNNNFSISGDRNVIKKEAEKILQHKNLTIEIQRMWNVKTKVIPVIMGATETISKSFRKYVSNIPGKHEVKELQKTAISGTAHILRKVLM